MEIEIIPVTLNPNDKGSGNTLSNGNLTVVNTSPTGIRATHGKSSGKWYWEVRFDSGNYYFSLGISNTSFRISSSITMSDSNWRVVSMNNSWGTRISKHPENALYNNSKWAVNDIIGIALDLDNGTLEFYKNGVSMGISHTNVKELGEVYPTFVAHTSETKAITFNFGYAPFSFTVPSGYMPYNTELVYVNKILLSSNNKTYSLTPPIYSTETAIPVMTSNTAPSGRAFASSELSASNGAWRAFDRTDGGSAYYNSASGTNGIGYLGYEFVNPIKIGKYSIRSLNTVGNSDTLLPKNWTFEGSNDGVNWIILDTQINQTWGTIQTDKDYIIDINKVNIYKMYRLNWTANGGGAYVVINELKMYESTIPQLISLPNQSEQTFLNHGIESPINITQLDGVKSIEANSTTHESGKTFTHTVDPSKRKVDKIILS